MTFTESTTIDQVELASIADELRAAGNREILMKAGSSTEKKNYAERLSRDLSTRIANELRSEFPGVLPNDDVKMQESRARGETGRPTHHFCSSGC